ncbi:hypothetical protein F503_06654 [Ophiostoma piceae UAMH 11346]|uniref:DUF4484 domain-containing protein n=1 Tax=Ophiostoma piceae (strain UAMH 11346) TaxID=1262450 RepID=S3BVN0_OPHP1|nr:hypothetical protein F503_06654 [Ophiostoma piceae UAMH 11346]
MTTAETRDTSNYQNTTMAQPSTSTGAGAPAGLLPDRPPIAALFLIEFDVKAGYTIVWKQAEPSIDLSGAVEYKSLPSGLHAVSEDLIYFVHEDPSTAENENGGPSTSTSAAQTTQTAQTAQTTNIGYAGLSAFVNLPTDDAGARNARMIAVGVLVPRSYGRLGRAWRHAEALLDLARTLAADGTQVPLLEAYWKENSSPAQTATETATPTSPSDDGDRPLLQIIDSPLNSPGAAVPPMTYRPSPFGSHLAQHERNRSASDGTALVMPPGHRLSPHHPAWSLTSLLETFGPLIFPIYRAALLRKRILISTHAPVREANNFVYNLSVLANIPISALDVVEPAAAAQLQRIRPLFTIGVNDITFLMDDYAASKRAAHQAGLGDSNGDAPYGGPGWIACTTDSILAMKGELWDVLITMPHAQNVSIARTPQDAGKRVWPTVEVAKGVPLKASQRDLRRFKALMSGLGGGSCETEQSDSKLIQLEDSAESVVEPVTWTALAYNGFMWWASAGEQGRSSDETDETIHDAQLLADIVPPAKPARTSTSASASTPTTPLPPTLNIYDSVTSLTARRAPNADGEAADDSEEEERARIELATITYFHRLTTQILSVLSDVVESSEFDNDGEYYYDNDDDDEAGDAYYDEADDGAGEDAEPTLGAGASVSSGDDDDALVSARRNGGLASSSSTSLLLRRRDGSSSRRRTGLAVRILRNSQPSRQRQSGSPHENNATPAVPALRISSEDVTRMGLDVWSRADAAFVQSVAQQYFGRRNVHVEGKGLEVCGLKVC